MLCVKAGIVQKHWNITFLEYLMRTTHLLSFVKSKTHIKSSNFKSDTVEDMNRIFRHGTQVE